MQSSTVAPPPLTSPLVANGTLRLHRSKITPPTMPFSARIFRSVVAATPASITGQSELNALRHSGSLHMVSPPPAPEASSFPFERLPPELKLIIVHFAMPPHGLRPQSTLCPLRGTCTLSDKLQSTTDREFWYNKHERWGLPTGLFYTNKWLSSTALAITYQHLPFYINIYPWGIMYHPQTLLFRHHFRSHISFQQLPQFRFLRNHRLNIMYDAGWYDDYRDKHQEDRDLYLTAICKIFKEQIRFVSDSLSANDNLESLSISVPCLCCLAGKGEMEAYSQTLNFLMPLQRLRVAKPIILEAVRDNGFDGLEGDVWLNLCSEPECQHLAEIVQASLHHLEGEQISEEEETWKRIKAMDGGDGASRSHNSRRSLDDLWTRLNHMQDTTCNATAGVFDDKAKRDFETCAWYAKADMQQDLEASAHG